MPVAGLQPCPNRPATSRYARPPTLARLTVRDLVLGSVAAYHLRSLDFYTGDWRAFLSNRRPAVPPTGEPLVLFEEAARPDFPLGISARARPGGGGIFC